MTSAIAHVTLHPWVVGVRKSNWCSCILLRVFGGGWKFRLGELQYPIVTICTTWLLCQNLTRYLERNISPSTLFRFSQCAAQASRQTRQRSCLWNNTDVCLSMASCMHNFFFIAGSRENAWVGAPASAWEECAHIFTSIFSNCCSVRILSWGL